MYLHESDYKIESVVSRDTALKNIRAFIENVEKPNVIPVTSYGITLGAGCVVMYDSDAPDEKTRVVFPLTAPDDKSTELLLNNGVLRIQDRLDMVHIFDQYFSSEGLIASHITAMYEYVFLNVYDNTSFSVDSEVISRSCSTASLVHIMHQAGKKNIDKMHQSLIFDKVSPMAKEDKK